MLKLVVSSSFLEAGDVSIEDVRERRRDELMSVSRVDFE